MQIDEGKSRSVGKKCKGINTEIMETILISR